MGLKITKAMAVFYSFVSQVFISVLFDFIDSILNQGCAHHTYTVYNSICKENYINKNIHNWVNLDGKKNLSWVKKLPLFVASLITNRDY